MMSVIDGNGNPRCNGVQGNEKQDPHVFAGRQCVQLAGDANEKSTGCDRYCQK